MTWHQLWSLTLSNKKQQLVTINIKQKHTIKKLTLEVTTPEQLDLETMQILILLVRKFIMKKNNQPRANKKQQLTTWSKGRQAWPGVWQLQVKKANNFVRKELKLKTIPLWMSTTSLWLGARQQLQIDAETTQKLILLVKNSKWKNSNYWPPGTKSNNLQLGARVGHCMATPSEKRKQLC